MTLWLVGYLGVALVAAFLLGRFFAATGIDTGVPVEHTASS